MVKYLLKQTVATTLTYGIGLLLLSSFCFAQIYQWRDKEGNLHFGDKPPVEAQTEKIELKINSYDSVEIVDGDEGTDKSKKSKKKNNRVVIYSTQWCSACKKAKKYFHKNSIPFQEYDVEKTEKGKRDYAALKGSGVPIIMIGKRRMNGFSASYFEAVYYKK